MSAPRLFRLRTLAFVCACALVAVVAQASAPTTVSYQGRLTDAGGAPVADGVHMATFAIYIVPSGGGAIWSEFQPVTTTDGLFSVLLGSSNPLTPAIFGDSVRYLGVTVGGDPELVPRTRFTSAAYTLRTATVDGSTGGVIYGNPLASALGAMTIYDFLGQGSGFDLTEESGSYFVRLDPDVDGTGGFLSLLGGGGSFFIDGNYGGTGNPVVGISGAQSYSYFNTDITGDPSVILPNDAVSSTEEFNEPGLSANFQFGKVVLGTSSMTGLASTTITIPAPGYIFVLGNAAELDYSGTTSYNWGFYQIDETSGGGLNSDLSVVGAYTFPSADYFFYSLGIQKIVYKAAPGTYTFYLEGMQYSGSGVGAKIESWNAKISAIYLPTSYGSVATPIAGTEVSQFEQATKEGLSGSAAAGITQSSDVYKVDLRELELKVMRTEAEAQKARAALAEAQMKKQTEARNVAAPAGNDK